MLNVTSRHESDPVFIIVSEIMDIVLFLGTACPPRPTPKPATRSSVLYHFAPPLGMTIIHNNPCKYILAPVHACNILFYIKSMSKMFFVLLSGGQGH